MPTSNAQSLQPQWLADRRRPTHSAGTMSRRAFFDIILYAGCVVSLFRGTQMWYGYPTSQGDFIPGRTFNMSGQLYLALFISLIYIAFNMREAMNALRPRSLLLTIFCVFVVISLVLSANVAHSFTSLFAIIAMALPILLAHARLGSERMFALMRGFAMAVIAVNLAYTVAFPHLAFMTGSLAGDMRGMFPHKNGFGHALAVFLILLAPTPGEKPFLRPAMVIRLFFFALTLVCTQLSHSSTALIQGLAGIMTIAGADMVRRVPGRTRRGMICIVTLIAIVALAYFGGTLLATSVTQGVGKDLTFSGRTEVWAALLPHLFDYPFTGHGFAMFRNVAYTVQFLKEVPFPVNSPHSTYIELLLNLGIPGAMCWFLFVLGRLFTKMVSPTPSVPATVVRNREVAIIVITLLGSATEAGQMLGPVVALPFLLAVLPLDPRQDRPAAQRTPRAAKGRLKLFGNEAR